MGCTTWWEMCVNGAGTGTEATTMRRCPRRIRRGLHRAPFACYGAAAGSTSPSIAARPIATTIIRTTSAAGWASGWFSSEVRRALPPSPRLRRAGRPASINKGLLVNLWVQYPAACCEKCRRIILLCFVLLLVIVHLGSARRGYIAGKMGCNSVVCVYRTSIDFSDRSRWAR